MRDVTRTRLLMLACGALLATVAQCTVVVSITRAELHAIRTRLAALEARFPQQVEQARQILERAERDKR